MYTYNLNILKLGRIFGGVLHQRCYNVSNVAIMWKHELQNNIQIIELH